MLGLKRLSVEGEVWLVEERGLVSGIACLKSKLALEQAASDTGLGRKEVYLVEERGLVSGIACLKSKLAL